MTVPVIPETHIPRTTDFDRVLDVLLGRTAAVAGKSKVLAHGMGGLGKTTLSAAVARHTDVRTAFARIGFVAAGQEPATLEEQRTLCLQLTGAPLQVEGIPTVTSQKESLAKAAAGQRWLILLDDVSFVRHYGGARPHRRITPRLAHTPLCEHHADRSVPSCR